MPFYIALLLGAVQGLTEFLPVSSSGHLALLQNVLNTSQYISDEIAFDIVLHLGTLVSVFIAFWDEIKKLFQGFFALLFDKLQHRGKGNRRLVYMLLIATAPMVVAVFIDDYIEQAFGNTLFIGCALLITAVMLFLSNQFGSGRRTAKDAPFWSAGIVGLMQLLAIFPGISRSGATISGGLLNRYDRDFAVSFAFLLSIPAIIGASVFKLPALFKSGEPFQLAYIWGFLAAAVTGYLAIRLVKVLIKRKSFVFFSIYCAVLGVVTIVLSLIK